MSLKVEVRKVAVRIRTMDARWLEGTIFLHTVAAEDWRPETLADRLNAPGEAFFPCEINGSVRLVRAESIAYVAPAEAKPELEELEEVGAVSEPVELRLANGDTVGGRLLYEAPPENRRVLDVLNVGRPRFLWLVADDAALLVRGLAIDLVTN